MSPKTKYRLSVTLVVLGAIVLGVFFTLALVVLFPNLLIVRLLISVPLAAAFGWFVLGPLDSHLLHKRYLEEEKNESNTP
jgi:hypothetical protein